eukprot:14927718-Alexandrium_andersonii.AAC.1
MSAAPQALMRATHAPRRPGEGLDGDVHRVPDPGGASSPERPRLTIPERMPLYSPRLPPVRPGGEGSRSAPNQFLTGHSGSPSQGPGAVQLRTQGSG